MIDLISEAFPHILDGCLQSIDNRHSYIFEDKMQNKGIFVTANDKHHLHIHNDSNNPYHFLQNDGCVMNNEPGGQCDYVILNPLNIYFTDVKVAKGNFANHRKDAYAQIENTYKFYNRRIDFPDYYNLYALVCFPNPRRIVKASASTKRREFREKYNIDLKEGNHIKFD